MESSKSDWRAHMVVFLVGALVVGFFCLMDSNRQSSRRGEMRDEAERLKQAEAALDAQADRDLKRQRARQRVVR